MWFTKIPGLIKALIQRQDETNRLLRELILKETGRHAHTPSRSVTGDQTPGKTRVRTGSDVWRRTPLSQESEAARSASLAEATASQPVDGISGSAQGSVDAPRPHETDGPASAPR